jgi:hypothetical protein
MNHFTATMAITNHCHKYSKNYQHKLITIFKIILSGFEIESNALKTTAFETLTLHLDGTPISHESIINLKT